MLYRSSRRIDMPYKTQRVFILHLKIRTSSLAHTLLMTATMTAFLSRYIALSASWSRRIQNQCVSCQYCNNFSPFGSAMEVGLSNVSMISFTLFFSSLSKRWPPVRSSADVMSYSTMGSGSRIKRAAVAILGRICHCNARISQRLLSIALLSNGSRSSMINGSPAPVLAFVGTSPPCGWSISLFSPGCRSNRLPMKNRIIWISSGGATNVRRASRFANAATNASGRCLKKRNVEFLNLIYFILNLYNFLNTRYMYIWFCWKHEILTSSWETDRTSRTDEPCISYERSQARTSNIIWWKCSDILSCIWWQVWIRLAGRVHRWDRLRLGNPSKNRLIISAFLNVIWFVPTKLLAAVYVTAALIPNA